MTLGWWFARHHWIWFPCGVLEQQVWFSGALQGLVDLSVHKILEKNSINTAQCFGKYRKLNPFSCMAAKRELRIFFCPRILLSLRAGLRPMRLPQSLCLDQILRHVQSWLRLTIDADKGPACQQMMFSFPQCSNVIGVYIKHAVWVLDTSMCKNVVALAWSFVFQPVWALREFAICCEVSFVARPQKRPKP